MSTPRILHVSTSDSGGGAARAAFRLHESLIGAGIDSRMRVFQKGSGESRVSLGPQRSLWRGRLHRAKAEIHRRWLARRAREWRKTNSGFHSFGTLSEGIVEELNASDADVLNLHWISELLSIADIGRLSKPIVWTIHDMWPFCGSEHYAPDVPDARFRVGYNTSNRPAGDRGPDLTRRAWEAKRQAWASQRFTIVGPSRWISECARQSVLLSSADVVTIPNPLDTGFPWRPIDRAVARDVLALPHARQLVLTGAMGGVSDPRKGGDLLRDAVASIELHERDFDVVVFGQHAPATGVEWPCRVHWLGPVRDDRTMALVYSAADVMAVPSRQDNLCQTAVEALACGTPVVAFDIGGMSDIVDHQKTGWLATPFDAPSYADGLRWALRQTLPAAEVSRAARAAAVARFSPEAVVPLYLHIYDKVLRNRSGSQAKQ